MKKINSIKEAVLSEKAYKLMEKGVYVFLIDRQMKKNEIAKIINAQFAVDVTKVNIINFKPRKKRVTGTRKFTSISGGKKAIVWLSPGQTIEMLSSKGSKSKKVKKIKETATNKKED